MESLEQDLHSIDILFRKLDKRAEKLYDFVYYYHKYMMIPRDYGTGDHLTAPLAHILTTIEEHPGLTITELAAQRNRTTSALSQAVKSLEKAGYIYKQTEGNNKKNLLLFVTEKGKHISQAHKIFDINDITSTTSELLKHCSVEELDTFYHVLTVYLNLLTK